MGRPKSMEEFAGLLEKTCKSCQVMSHLAYWPGLPYIVCNCTEQLGVIKKILETCLLKKEKFWGFFVKKNLKKNVNIVNIVNIKKI